MEFKQFLEAKELQSTLSQSMYRLGFKDNAKRISPLLITSTDKGEGKTFVTLGLAATYNNFFNKKVLLVDFNWGHSELHSKFNLENKFIFDSVTVKKLQDSIQRTSFDKLDVLTSPKEIVNDFENNQLSDVFGQFLNWANDNYDGVIIDSSFLMDHDTKYLNPMFLASLVSSVIMVVKGRKTIKERVKIRSMALRDVNPKLSIIMNNCENPFYL